MEGNICTVREKIKHDNVFHTHISSVNTQAYCRKQFTFLTSGDTQGKAEAKSFCWFQENNITWQEKQKQPFRQETRGP